MAYPLCSQSGSNVDDSRQLFSSGGFCSILARNLTTRLFLSFIQDRGLFLHRRRPQPLDRILPAGNGRSLKDVLRTFHLTPKDKVMLSYAVARSYWQYYDSLLMGIKWTSDTIWFMQAKDDDGLPLRAYLSFPFGIPNNTAPDILHEDLLSHQCPRIFDIGILLLEIGLSKPFATGFRRDMVAQANLNHTMAKSGLIELEKMVWDGFTNHKKHFDRAVEFCLNSENFILRPRSARNQQGVAPRQTEIASDDRKGVATRRRIFHKHVVRPLAWLAKKGFTAQAGDITSVKRSAISPQRQGPSVAEQPTPEAAFHTAIVPSMWLRDLMKIGTEVEQKRRKCQVTTPVRIAILDTGLDEDFPVFKKIDGLLRRVTDKMDLVEPNSSTLTDEFGHGTFMARLVMECTPGTEILLVRVAEKTSRLKNCQENIKKVGIGKPLLVVEEN